MFRISALVCALSAYLAIASAVTCPDYGSFVPHDTDCKKYYICDSLLKPLLHECGPELVWDPQYHLCNWPKNVAGCENYYTGDNGPDCPVTGIHFYPDPADCHGYYRCENGVSSRYMCGLGMAWDVTINGCNWPVNVASCGITTTTTTTTTARPITGINCPVTGIEFFADPDDCHWYYRCENGVPSHYQCGLSLAWDKNLRGCNSPDQVASCSVTTTTPTPTLYPAHVDCSLGIYFADFNDCDYYYRCNNGNVYHFPCGLDMIYDRNNFGCRPREEVVQAPTWCDGMTTTTAPVPVTVCYPATDQPPVCADIPPAVDETDPAENIVCMTVDSSVAKRHASDMSEFECKKNGKFRHPRQSEDRKYINCHNGVARERQCRKGLVFDVMLHKCTRLVMAE